jgi:hypothetical protein
MGFTRAIGSSDTKNMIVGRFAGQVVDSRFAGIQLVPGPVWLARVKIEDSSDEPTIIDAMPENRLK